MGVLMVNPVAEFYVLLEKRGEKEQTLVRIVQGKYKNIIYRYGTVRFGDQENDNGMLSCKFDYKILENPNNVEKEQDFDLLLGDIMVDILDKQITTGFHMGGVSLSGTSFQEEGSTYYRTSGDDIVDNGIEKMAENMMYNIDDYRKKEED
tara:strand:- start:345 stop:794 length:450 start_codon:yes stop_codon:yes gene_type:complete